MSMFSASDSITINVKNSSLIKQIEWTNQSDELDGPQTGDLCLQFLNGEKYIYIDVSSDIITNLLESKSMGAFFHKEIRNKYTTKKEEN